MKYRWDGMYCVDTTDGEIVGRSFKYDSNPDRWVAERGGSKSLYISAEQARAAVEQGICGRDGTIEHSPRTNMLKEITTDAKAFIHDNRNIIYWLALAFLADHFFFGGAFRQRLNALVEKMIGRVEKQLEAKA